MARAIAKNENGRWIVLIDVDQYGGDELSCGQADAFARDVRRAVQEARDMNTRNAVMRHD